MTTENIKVFESCDASIVRKSGMNEEVIPSGVYSAECIGPNGEVKWTETFKNTVTTVGKNSLLDVYLGASTQITTWYFGLISANSYSAISSSDTMSVHTGWREAANSGASAPNPQYSQGTRPSASWSAASSGSKSVSAASSFSIITNGTVKGAFLVSNNTKGGSTGVLYSAGLFTAGDKIVGDGDVLNVSYTATAS